MQILARAPTWVTIPGTFGSSFYSRKAKKGKDILWRANQLFEMPLVADIASTLTKKCQLLLNRYLQITDSTQRENSIHHN